MACANVIDKAVAVLLAAFLSLSVGMAAEPYPTGTIRIVVGFPPGGGVDTSARIVGNALSQELKQTVIVENKPGAAGTIAATEVAKSKPDGYTLLVAPGGHSIYGAYFRSLPFDTVESFTWISGFISVPFLVAVPGDSPFKTMADLIAKAKTGKEVVSFGSAGQGSTHQLGAELLGIKTGVKFLHVPYRGDAPLVAAVLANDVNFGLVTPTLVQEHVQSGKLRILAVATDKRFFAMPDVPTVNEALGLKDFNVGSWFGLAGPAGLPADVTATLNSAVKHALKTEDVRGRLAALGGEINATTPQELHATVERELRMWTETVNTAGIERQQ